jgi:predicted permease
MNDERENREKELDREVQDHLELDAEAKMDRGLGADEARYAAQREFGNATMVKEVTREMWGWASFERLWQDVRFALRMIRRNPGFTTVAILTLALGIGANTAIFSVVNGVLLNPLPYPEPDRLISVYAKTSVFSASANTYLNILDWQKDNHSFADLAIQRGASYFLTGSGEGERVHGSMISANFFAVMGVNPILGRVFHAEEDRAGAAPVVLIGAGIWSRKFDSSPDIVGKAITLNGKSHVVVGVIPASFSLYGNSTDVYVPIGQWDDPTFRDRKISFGTEAIGRLKPGVTIQQAQADLDQVARSLAAAYPEADKDQGIELIPFKKVLVGDIQPSLIVLFGAVGFVLLIACANVANLLLARSSGRGREFAIRNALGAGRMRIVRQLLTESSLLAAAGGALGLGIAYWGTNAVLQTLPKALPRAHEIGLDAHVLLFTLGVSLLVGVLFGLTPALKLSRSSVAETLKEGGRGSSGAHHRTQSTFVAVELALALVLLVGAGLMVRTLSALWGVDPGFNPHNVLSFDMTLPAGLERNIPGLRATFRQIHETLMSIPGVKYVSMQGGAFPMSGAGEVPFWMEGESKPATESGMKSAIFYLVDPDYLKVMGTPLLRGRFFTEQENEHARPVIVIDEVFARKYFPGEDPIGKRINLDIFNTEPEVIGIAGHVKHWGLDSDAKAPIQAQIYMPFVQLRDTMMPLAANDASIAARIEGPPSDVTKAIRATMTKLNGNYVVHDVTTMDEIVAGSLAERRFSMILLGIFAALALALSSIGIYGVVSYVVGQRTHEIGIRMALGASRSDVLKMVLGHGMKMALAGVGIGLAVAIRLTRLMSKMLFQVTATDPITLATVGVLLTGVALAACWIPARRATRVDPIVALRYE